MQKQWKAFTLIELLIVVAIIGILAAIAVPNFLNAQIRAKLAKVKSDFKAISTAMEQYYLDRNYYPPPFKLTALTTPISYLTSVPQDVFPPKMNKGSGQGEAYANTTWYRYVYGTKDTKIGGSDGLRIAHCADYYAYFPPFLLRSAAETMAGQKGCPTVWLVKTFATNVGLPCLCGGTTSFGTPNGDDCTFRYDPSNGLVSIGDIAVFGPGGMVE